MDENPVNHWAKRDDAESLHQCLHQIGHWVESNGPESLVAALAELLGEDALERLADAISQRAVRG